MIVSLLTSGTSFSSGIQSFIYSFIVELPASKKSTAAPLPTFKSLSKVPSADLKWCPELGHSYKGAQVLTTRLVITIVSNQTHRHYGQCKMAPAVEPEPSIEYSLYSGLRSGLVSQVPGLRMHLAW